MIAKLRTACAIAMSVGLLGMGCGATKPKIRYPTHALYDRATRCEPGIANPRLACPRYFDLRKLLGLGLGTAVAHAKEHGLTLRVVEKNGHPGISSREYVGGRVDIATSDGVVTRIVAGS